MASIIYSDAIHKGVWLVSNSTSGSPQLVARNFAFVAAGIYLWECVQCALFDLRLLGTLATRFCLLPLRAFCAVDDRCESISIEEPSDSKSPSYRSSLEHGQGRSCCSDAWVSDLAFPVLNTIAQFAYILLRLSTFLALLSILAVLNSLDGAATNESSPDLTSSCLGRNDSSNVRCRIELLLRLGSLVAPLLSLTCSNLLVLLRVVSVWTPCGCESLLSNANLAESIPRRPPGWNNQQQLVSFPRSHESRHIIAFKGLALLLHLVQYVLVVLVGLAESSTLSGITGDTERRKLLIASLTYSVVLDVLAMSWIVIGVMRWKDLGRRQACLCRARSDCVRERSSSPVFARSHGRLPRSDCATEGGVSSYGTLSDMSFAQKSNIYSSDTEETNSETSIKGDEFGIGDIRRSRSLRSSVDCKSADGARGDTNRMSSVLSKNESCRQGNKTSDSHGSDGRRGTTGVKGTKEKGVESRIACNNENHGGRGYWVSCVWTTLFAEGRHRGLLWILASSLMKIGVLMCIALDNPVGRGVTPTLGFSMRFFLLAFVFATIASGRLFLLMTRASPIGDGYMEARDPPPPWSPSASLLDVGVMTPPVADDRPRRPSLSYQARPITLVRLDVLPSYVERRLYTRRVRHEMEAAAGGALRTIGGTVLPSPVLVPERSRRTREKCKSTGGEASVQASHECAGMSAARPDSGPV